ncbi:MAG TPA: hypothetical protein VK835_06695 [Bacteroidia bacterium]|jgi:hypothetical protein|nr:hypothetical protein [Bacteroidia bacterium]
MEGAKKTYWITTYTLIFIFVFMLFTQNYWRFWDTNKKETPFQWDADNYYSYLPAAFIYHDLSFSYTTRYWLTTAPNGNGIAKGTYGMALMYSPFFFIGHQVALAKHKAITGYSEPYGTWVHYGSLFYGLMGLVILGFVLRRFYTDKIIALTLLTLFFASNLFYYTMRDGEMSHCYTFFLISLFMLLTCKWHENKKSIYFLWIGLVVGLLSVIRPTEILIFIIFIGYGVKSLSDFTGKLKQVIFSFKNIPLFLVGFFTMWLPQMIYWKMKAGSFLFFSYGSDERFFWLDPQIINLLFSYRKGWFVYTPIMLFAVISLLFILKRKSNDFKMPILVYMTLNIYMLSSWWCWWYGGGFGMRALVQAYALLAIPLAGFYQFIFSLELKKQFVGSLAKVCTVFLVSGFLCLNIIQTHQYDHPLERRLMHYDSMSKAAYWRVFGKFSLSDEDFAKYAEELSPAKYDEAKKGERNN